MSAEFTYTTYLKASRETVWHALVNPDYTAKYWGVVLESDWEVGSPVTWEVAGISIKDPEQIVLAAEAPREIAFTWHTISPEFGEAVGGDAEELAAMASEERSAVSFVIEPAGSVTKLTLHHTDFEEGSTILAAVTDGWPMVISSLKTLLETGEALTYE